MHGRSYRLWQTEEKKTALAQHNCGDGDGDESHDQETKREEANHGEKPGKRASAAGTRTCIFSLISSATAKWPQALAHSSVVRP